MDNKSSNRNVPIVNRLDAATGDNYIKWAIKCLTLKDRKFQWSEDLVKLYKDCLLYSTRASHTTLDLNKGLCVLGSYGTGKTTLMKCLQEFVSVKSSTEWDVSKTPGLKIITAREAVRQFQRRGFEALEGVSYKRIGDGLTHPQGPLNLCIDDIGQCEDFAVYYGTKTNVIKELLADRYDIFCKYGSKTHITSNLTAEMLRERYGDYIASRMNEMFNILILTGSDHRKGKAK